MKVKGIVNLGWQKYLNINHHQIEMLLWRLGEQGTQLAQQQSAALITRYTHAFLAANWKTGLQIHTGYLEDR